MFKVQTKEYSLGRRWQDLKSFHRNRFVTEEDAWAYVESLDQDGVRDTGNFRVVPA
jgi:hypothetical protein